MPPLIQIIACRLVGTKPLSVNQCWNIVNWNIRSKLRWNFNRNWYISLKKKMHLKILSAKWRPCCLSLNVLSHHHIRGPTVWSNQNISQGSHQLIMPGMSSSRSLFPAKIAALTCVWYDRLRSHWQRTGEFKFKSFIGSKEPRNYRKCKCIYLMFSQKYLKMYRVNHQ